MRKLLRKFAATMLVAFGILQAAADDQIYQIGNLSYRITSDTECEVATNNYTEDSNDVTIPEKVTIEGKEYTVTAIGDFAFRVWYIGYLPNFSSITLPPTIKTIGESAFACTNITEIDLPESLTCIKKYAFSDTSLKSIKLPSGITEIPIGMCAGCNDLSEVTLPNAIKRIGNSSFYSCSSLKEIEMPNSVEEFFEEYYTHGPFENSGLEKIKLSDNLKVITGGAFSNCISLTELELPANLKTIKTRAFSGCSSLSEVTIPESTDSIFGGVFEYCSSLEEIHFPDNLKYLGRKINQEWNFAGGSVFQGSGLKSVTIPKGLEYIGEDVFSGCPLENVVMHDGIKEIGSSAFGNTNLRNVELPAHLQYIGEDVFYNCQLFESINISDENETYASVDGVLFTKDMKTLVIYPYAHGDTFTIPATVENLPKDLYSTLLKNIYVEEGNAWYTSQDGVLFDKMKKSLILYPIKHDGEKYTVPNGVVTIGDFAFYSSPLTEVELPNSLSEIQDYAFGSSSLTSIIFPSGLKKIGDNAFKYTQIETLVIPASVDTIGMWCFNGCSNLMTVNIEDNPEGVSSHMVIDCGAFYNYMGEIYIGSSVREIGEMAFMQGSPQFTLNEGLEIIGSSAFCYYSDNVSLGDIVFPSTLKEIGPGNFPAWRYQFNSITSLNPEPPIATGNAFNTTVLYVPSQSIIKYKVAEGWKTIPNIVTIGDDPCQNQLIDFASPWDPSVELASNNDCEGDDNSHYLARTDDVPDYTPAAFTERGVGSNGMGRAYMAQSTTWVDNPKGSEFVIVLSRALEEEEEYLIFADVKSEQWAQVSVYSFNTETWESSDNNVCNIPFGTSWASFLHAGTVSADMAGSDAIALALNVTNQGNVYYLDNIHFVVKKKAGIEDVIMDADYPENSLVDVYSITGVLVKHNVTRSEATTGLRSGIYIVGGHKIAVK